MIDKVRTLKRFGMTCATSLPSAPQCQQSCWELRARILLLVDSENRADVAVFGLLDDDDRLWDTCDSCWLKMSSLVGDLCRLLGSRCSMREGGGGIGGSGGWAGDLSGTRTWTFNDRFVPDAYDGPLEPSFPGEGAMILVDEREQNVRGGRWCSWLLTIHRKLRA